MSYVPPNITTNSIMYLYTSPLSSSYSSTQRHYCIVCLYTSHLFSLGTSTHHNYPHYGLWTNEHYKYQPYVALHIPNIRNIYLYTSPQTLLLNISLLPASCSWTNTEYQHHVSGHTISVPCTKCTSTHETYQYVPPQGHPQLISAVLSWTTLTSYQK